MGLTARRSRSASQDPIDAYRTYQDSLKRDIVKADTWCRDQEKRVENDKRDKALAERDIEMAGALRSVDGLSHTRLG